MVDDANITSKFYLACLTMGKKVKERYVANAMLYWER